MDRRRLFAVGLAAFVLIGAQQAVYGPAFASLQARYGVAVEVVGAIVSAHFLGGLAGILLGGVMLRALGYRRVVPLGSLVIAVGMGLVAVAPTWPLALAGAALGGIGFGLLDVLLNLAFARGFGARSTAALGVLNAAFGAGAVLGPLPVAALAARGWGAATLPPVAGGIAVCALLVAVAAIALRNWPPVPAADRPDLGRLRWGVVVTFALMLSAYVGVEASTAAWAPTHLATVFDPGRAALAASIFWGALTIGRLLAAFTPRVAPATFVTAGGAAAAAALVLAQVAPRFGLVAYALAGLALAPVFPATIAWLTRVFPARAERVAPIVLAAAAVGPIPLTPAVGQMAAWLGDAWLPFALLLPALVMVALALGIRRVTQI